MPSGRRSPPSEREKSRASPTSESSERDTTAADGTTDERTLEHPFKHLCDYIVFSAKADLEKLVRDEPSLAMSEPGLHALNCFTQMIGDVIWVLGYYQVSYGDEFFTPTGEFVDVLRSEETR
jgi:hypothetical protein